MEKPTILVVEDEPAIADTIQYALESEGFRCLRLETGSEVVEVLDRQPVALVVLDIGLPDVSGVEVCRRIRQRHDVPVIFLTARGGEVDRVVGLELGADDYVIKPFSPRELAARAKAVLRRARPGVYDLYSIYYLRHWLAYGLMRGSRALLLPVFTTWYLTHHAVAVAARDRDVPERAPGGVAEILRSPTLRGVLAVNVGGVGGVESFT